MMASDSNKALVESSTWGIGYGNRVHLIDHDRVSVEGIEYRRELVVPAACSRDGVYLEFFDQGMSFDAQFGRLATCARCAAKAAERNIPARKVVR